MESQVPPTYTLDEALCTVGFGRFQGLALLYAGLGWIAESMEIMLLSFIGSAVKSEWNLSSDQESLITSIVFSGMLIGAYSWGLISDNFGRKKAFLGICTVTAVAGSLSSLSQNYVSLIVVRWLVGIGLGGGHLFTTWFLEFVPTPNRGTWMVVFSAFWTVGTIFEAGLAWIIMPRLGWRWLLAVSSIPAFLLLAFFVLVHETPRFLIMKGRIGEAQVILEKIAQFNKSSLPPGQLVPDLPEDQDKELSFSSDTHLEPKRKKMISLRKCLLPKYVLVSPKYIRTTILLWFLYFGNTFVYYGVVLLTSKLSSGQNQCRGDVISHSGTSEDSKLYINVFVTSLAEFPGLVISAIILDRLGRKYSMQIMLAFGFGLLLPLAWQLSQGLTTGLLFGARMFVSATFTCACIYAPEVYPTIVRSSGVGVATAIGRIGGIVCPMVAVTLVNNCHQTAAILLFEAAIVLLGICVVLLPFETMGKGLIDVAK
ncbi:organic cation/carnitine transporter 7-like [Impatiens glandulifera]|uniref:organic cation/carnitine transporter 7-like n=1 Tax=Impatiens glandulifera TaxID=253017 RepID=UPI001FB0CBD6|nr:organic cation/carnitine transporter 7-like [Impatiens glandulifera]